MTLDLHKIRARFIPAEESSLVTISFSSLPFPPLPQVREPGKGVSSEGFVSLVYTVAKGKGKGKGTIYINPKLLHIESLQIP